MARYFLRFGHADTGLTPTFTCFKKVSDLSDIGSPPTIIEITGGPGPIGGTYYFDYSPTFDIIYEVDGGVAVTDPLVRYISDTISPRDIYVDEPTSQVKTDVWNEPIAGHATDGTFGQMLQAVDYGQAQTGAGSTVTLAAGASAINSFYLNALILITSGTGAGQSRSITVYVGSTKIATVDRAWGTNPDGTSHYLILPAAGSAVDNAAIASAVWDVTLASHLTAGSTGAKLNTSGGGGGGVQFFANGDTVKPIIVQVASPKHTQVRITFSEPVVMTAASNGALNLLNYSTTPPLTISAITALTAQQVLLTTSTQIANQLYSLTVSNVEDLQGNPIL